VKKYADVVQDTAGNAVAGASVAVYTTLGAAADLYADAAGLVPHPTNVVTTDSKGYFEFYTVDGRYNVSATKGDIYLLRQDVEIVDAASFSDAIGELQSFAVNIGETANQITITPDVDGNLILGTPQNIGPTSSPTFNDLSVRKLTGKGAPTLSSWGTGAGASASPSAGSITGTDLFVIVSVTPSASPAANSPIASIAWSGGNGMFTTAPTCAVLALNRNAYAAASSTAAGVIATGGVNGITLTSGASTPLTADTTYLFGILVLGA